MVLAHHPYWPIGLIEEPDWLDLADGSASNSAYRTTLVFTLLHDETSSTSPKASSNPPGSKAKGSTVRLVPETVFLKRRLS